MKVNTLCALLSFCLLAPAQAAIPSAEKLLPDDTLFLCHVPDSDKLGSTFANSPTGQFWRDPAMKPFKDKFLDKLTTEVIKPLERELGISFADYKGLAKGQFTVAVTQNGWTGSGEPLPAVLLLIDTKDQGGKLKERLTDIRQKWTDAGKQLKTERIRDTEFTTLLVSGTDLDAVLKKILPNREVDEDANPGKSGRKIEILIGQHESLLLVGSSAAALEKVLIRLSGGLVPSLAEQPAYEANHMALFRDAQIYLWVHARPLAELAEKAFANAPQPDEEANPFTMMPSPDKVFAGSGLASVHTAAITYRESSDGSFLHTFLNVPQAGARGLFKVLAIDAKDAAPPAFVPADAVKFNRWRVDLPKSWTHLEALVAEIFPPAAGAFKFIFEYAGKDQDPTFDLRRELFGNLGDDIIVYEKKPRQSTVAELNSPPSLFLVGSPQPENLANAIKVAVSSLGQGGGVKDREFLGRKVYSLEMGSAPLSPAADMIQLNFAASTGYLAISTDVAMLEEFLRSSDGGGRPLAQTLGLNEAAEKVGGMRTGLFGFNNQAEEMRVTWEVLEKEGNVLGELFGAAVLNAALSGEPDGAKLKEWLDFTLLPSFDAIAKYFHYTVYSGSAGPNGYDLKLFAPTPPQLKK